MSGLVKIKPVLIGLTGAKGSGKDTTADYLCSTYGFSRLAFADPIRKGLAAMFSVDVSMLSNPDLKETPFPELLGCTPRHLMQTLGTEWGRQHVHPTAWAEIAKLRIESIRASGQPWIVVTDVRFDNEAEILVKLGGVIWEVVGGKSKPGSDGHVSEAGIDRSWLSTTIHNNSTLLMLHTQIGVNLERAARLQRPGEHPPL